MLPKLIRLKIFLVVRSVMSDWVMSSSATERGQLYRGGERRKGDLMSERESTEME